MLAEPILVGRERELEELQRYLDSAVEGKGTTVFVSGEAGSGKTRLTREFLEAARKRGVGVMAGWCLSDAQVPYFPFVEAFNSYYTSSDGKQPESLSGPGTSQKPAEPFQMITQERGITSWLKGPEQAVRPGKPEMISAQVWKDQLFAGVAKTLQAISSQNPVVLFIEDVHWADSASLALIHYVARAVHDSERVLVLATFRSEELTADAEGHPHPLAETLRLMRREELFTEITLSKLSQTSVSKMAESMIGGSLHPELAEKLATESRGNPLFVVESLRMLHERKSLIQENNQWRLAVDELGIPRKIKDIILRRLACLKYAQRRVLDAASVIGEEFDVELLSTVLGQDSLDVLETLNVVAHSTSLVRAEENRYGFDHARSRETLYEELSMPLKRGYHNRIAEKLESTKSAALPLSELAYHFAQAGNKEKAVKFALAAGQDALARWSNTDAIKHFTYVLQAAGEDPQRLEERLNAMEGLGDAFYANNMFTEATRIFENIADTTATDALRLRAYRKAMEAVFQYGDMPHLMELVKKAEPYAGADRLENARILGSRARFFTMRNMAPAALEAWEAALPVFEEEYSLWDAAWALIGIASMHALFDVADSGVKQGLAEILSSIALFEGLRDFRWQMEASWGAGLVCHMCLLDNEAVEMFERAIETDERIKMGDYLRLAYANADKARSFWGVGDFRKGLACSLKALEASKKTDSALAHGMVYSNLTIEYALLGDVKSSEEYFDKLIKLPPEILPHVFVQTKLAKAVLFAVKNQWKESKQTFEELVELNARMAPPFALRFKLLYSWALEKQGRVEEAKTLREEALRGYRNAEERFAHASVQGHFMARRQVVAGEEFEMRLDLVNVGRKHASLVEVKHMSLSNFQVLSSPSWCSIQEGAINMRGEEIGAFRVNTVKLIVKCLKPGTFTFEPQVVYVDDLGKTETCKIKPLFITVSQAQPKVRPGRVSSGMAELDELLLGGIPEKYSVILTAASSDERELFIKRFLETAAQAGQTTLFLTTEAGYAKALAETFSANFSLFICSPQAELMTENQLNICKLKGVENLTEIDIALAKYFRTLDPSKGSPRIACVQVVSDVLLQHHAVITRKWLTSLLANLKSKGFTTLAVIDSHMHSPEETQAVLGLFDGEIRIAEREGAKGPEKVLKILKLHDQEHLEDELILTKENLKSKS
jgi:KaiC/GvpD/RAD55 family RecA-like ATPase/tetratricopeptide (TPR) repeat protein